MVQGLNNCLTAFTEAELAKQKFERPAPLMRFNEQLDTMMCKSNNGSVFIYKKKNLKMPDEHDDENVPEMEWVVHSVINDIHSSILFRSRELFLFDPNFEYYFNISYNSESFVVYKVLDIIETGRCSELHKKIDTKFFNITLKGNRNMQNISRLVSRMQMMDD
jgi:hypothetical protein